MLRGCLEDLDYFRLCRDAKGVSETKATKKIKIALLGDFASQQISIVLKTLFFRNNVYADILESEFDSIDHYVYSDDSQLEAFSPDIILLLESTQSLRKKYYTSRENAVTFAGERSEGTEARWDKLKQKCPGAMIFQSNFVLPYERPFGNYGHRIRNTFFAAVQTLNHELNKLSGTRQDVYIVDIDSIASFVGKKSWFDERLWALYKYPCALENFPRIAQLIVDIALALKGSSIKCVIVDLDNTLWGGTIGDDGLEGIKLGHGDEGEAYLLFQSFLLELKKRGILLAVCSKNDPENAKLPFQKHPEMVLRENDFAVFVANWADKPDNIRLIQETLNIGFDSILFLDDSIFERNFVRQSLPEIVVPELPEDPADYVKHLSELNLFETASYSETDSSRTRMYQEEFQRKLSKVKFEDHEDYLRSLDMKITLERLKPERLARFSQLLQRSNQFNLSARRYTEAQCALFMKDENGFFPLCVTLKDKFGEYGLVSCAVISWKGPIAVIDEWVMSCRVLFRGVEQCAMNYVVELSKQKNARQIEGEYIPSDKNKLVKDFYPRFGFRSKEKSESGAGRWTLDIAEYVPQKIWMEIQSDCLVRPV